MLEMSQLKCVRARHLDCIIAGSGKGFLPMWHLAFARTRADWLHVCTRNVQAKVSNLA